jgi:UDP-N-acetylmuramate: L-alanyl-gamma-D-glutamyl-meso-diaminopimelate ligase
MGDKARVAYTIDELVDQVMATVTSGDHLVCMSNGGFGGVHERLLNALQTIRRGGS